MTTQIQLKSQRFRDEREWDWRRLDTLLRKVESRSATALTDEELLAIPVLYRATLSSLSTARATSLDQGLIEYLESLCSRAYFVIYSARSSLAEQLANFFRQAWPASVKAVWKETLLSALLLIAGVVVGYLLVAQDADWFYSIMPGEMSGGRDPAASAAYLRSTLNHTEGASGLSFFSASLFTHNSMVALFCFALGFAFGVPTVLLIFWQGCSTGALMAVFASKGLGMELGGWLTIHGTTEIFAIVLAGGAGLHIAKAVAFPGEHGRMEAAAASGKTAGAVMGGVVIMLMCAGLLEGFGRQLIGSDLARYAIGAVFAVMWLSYFYLPRRGKVAHGQG